MIFFFMIFALTGSFWFSSSMLLGDKGSRILDLEDEQKILNEKLISAQILANKLDRVYTLFQENLALSEIDSLAEDASLPFLNNLTELLDAQGITLLGIKPRLRTKTGDYYSSPYEITINCTFEQLGSFIGEIEKSSRLVIIDEFEIKNGIERVKNFSDPVLLKKQNIELKLSTITLIKTQAIKTHE